LRFRLSLDTRLDALLDASNSTKRYPVRTVRTVRTFPGNLSKRVVAWKKRSKRICKPGFVCREAVLQRSPDATIISLGRRLLAGSSSLPGGRTDRTDPRRRAGRSHARRLPPVRPCSPRGLPSRRVAPPLVSSYLTISPLPRRDDEDIRRRAFGGMLSVALSRTLRSVGVTHHGALWSPDFPPAAPLRSLGDRGSKRPAIVQFASSGVQCKPAGLPA
jgi:hypothetical protein